MILVLGTEYSIACLQIAGEVWSGRGQEGGLRAKQHMTRFRCRAVPMEMILPRFEYPFRESLIWLVAQGQ
jgi:hypothetical protein